MATTRDELLRLLDGLSDENAAELLEYAHWLQQDGETLSDEEVERVQRGERQLERGEGVSWDPLRRELNV
jgi:hypothetical protein